MDPMHVPTFRSSVKGGVVCQRLLGEPPLAHPATARRSTERPWGGAGGLLDALGQPWQVHAAALPGEAICLKSDHVCRPFAARLSDPSPLH